MNQKREISKMRAKSSITNPRGIIFQLITVLSMVLFLGCGGVDENCSDCDSDINNPEEVRLPPECYEPYASELIEFTEGVNAGFGKEKLPDVVLGPTVKGGLTFGALDVLTLGSGGVITLGFSGSAIFDGPGIDFIVWENPFYLNGDPTTPYAELGEVSVSEDGLEWVTFACTSTPGEDFGKGCAGLMPRKEFDPCEVLPLDPALVGGDQFDLSSVGMSEARFVRIRDLSYSGDAPTAGFDLDAVGAVHLK